jgi:hypothetical protein
MHDAIPKMETERMGILWDFKRKPTRKGSYEKFVRNCTLILWKRRII